MADRRFHEVANIFPMMTPDELDTLTEDIRVTGLRAPIWLHPDGSIIDGRNRFMACRKAGVNPAYRTWDGQGSLVAFVLSLNLHRRHLNESQRAMVAAKVATLGHGQRQSGQLAGVPTQTQAAEMVGVGERSVRRAKEVLDSAAPELTEAVERGDVPVSSAAAIVDKPAEEQRALVEAGPKAVREAAKQAKAKPATGQTQYTVRASINAIAYVRADSLEEARRLAERLPLGKWNQDDVPTVLHVEVVE